MIERKLTSRRRQTGLEQQLLDEQIPWNKGRFLPNDAFDRILTESAVQRELDSMYNNVATSDLADKVYKKARKVLGVLVCIRKAHSIKNFIIEDITDKLLPLTIPKNPIQQKVWMSRWRAFQDFSPRELNDFAIAQWSFLSPIFSRQMDGEIKHYDFPNGVVLPFIEDEEAEMRSGGFGQVWNVQIHPDHHNFNESVSFFLNSHSTTS